MKDRQVEQNPQQMRIPVVSAVLHCVSMTVIVLMRSSFGIVYLRPKSVFMVFSYAFALFFIAAWHDRKLWTEYRLVCFYGLAVVLAYHAHLIVTLFRELYRNGEHDNDSGTAHTIRVLRILGKPVGARFEMNWHVWFEPLGVLLCALALLVVGEKHLSKWLLFVAPCLCFKEALNYWFQVRQKKRHRDSRDDAEDIFDDTPNTPQVEAPKAVGKDKVKRTRASTKSVNEDVRERQAAQTLRLLPPYTLEVAEQNYRKLIKEYHPDPNEATPENNELSAQLNEAIAYFRERGF